MIAIFGLLFVLLAALMAIRTATAALTLTGMSRDLARFQSISAFTGVGFTTAESEAVMNHPVRRRIVMALMVIGNIGIVTAASSLILTFMERDAERWLDDLLLAVLGLAVSVLLSFNRKLDVLFHRNLREWLRRFGVVHAQDFEDILHLTDEFSVSELIVPEEHWLEGRKLSDARLNDEGVTVLGIHREDGSWVGVPRGETRVDRGDRLVVYGRAVTIEDLTERRRDEEGDAHHEEAVVQTRHQRAVQLQHERLVEAEERLHEHDHDLEHEHEKEPAGGE